MSEDNPKVMLGGREFPVPELGIYQLRKVVPAMSKLVRIFDDPAGALMAFDEESFDLMLDTVFVGIAPGSPGFTKADFDKLPAKPLELAMAMRTIALQSGMAQAKKPGEPDTGEALATASSTGMKSSRRSASRQAGLGTTSN